MRWSRGRRGLTLIETLVTSTVLLLVMGVLTAVYVRSSKVWQKVDRETTLLRDMQVAIRAMERNVTVGHPKGVTRGTNSLAFLSCQDTAGNITVGERGRPIWQKFVIHYVDSEGLLRQTQFDRPSPDDEPRSFFEETSGNLDDYLASNSSPDHRKLTHEGRIIELSLMPTGHYGSLYLLKIEAEQVKTDKPAENIVLETEVSVRNSNES